MGMQWSNTWTVLVVMLLSLGVLLLRHLEYRHFSDAEIEDTLSTLCGEYALLQQKHTSDEQWRAFAQKAADITAPIIADIENNPSSNQEETRILYYLARYRLPEAMACKGNVSAAGLVHSLYNVKLQRQKQSEDLSENGFDLVTAAIFVVATLLVLYLGYLHLPTLKSRFLTNANNAEEMLRQLNGKIEKEPASARYRGLRARLLTKLGRYADAVADIDWILQHLPQGADLDQWHRLRETVGQKQAVTK